MRRVEIYLAIFFSLALLPGRVYAQKGVEDYLIVDRLSRETGLPDQDINGIYFDSKGYAWISTFGGGLVRYDGDSFIKFSRKTDPTPSAISSANAVRMISEDFGYPVPGAWISWT